MKISIIGLFIILMSAQWTFAQNTSEDEALTVRIKSGIVQGGENDI